MKTESIQKSEAKRWLRYAKEDLNVAKALINDPQSAIPRHICWLSEQAAEKALKAVLIFLKIDFQKTHDLDTLRNKIPNDWSVKRHNDLAFLTEWSVEARYPGDWEEASQQEAIESINQAIQILNDVETEFAEKGINV